MKIVYKRSFMLRLGEQLKYIARDNPTAALRLKDRFKEALSHTPRMPKMAKRSIYFDDENIRDLIVEGYTLVYRIRPDRIEVFGLANGQEGVDEDG